MDKQLFARIWENIGLFIHGATDFKRKSKTVLTKESNNEMDEFILLCFGDQLGIPISTSYYSLELLPLLAKDLETWQFRMSGRKVVWQEKWGDYGFDG